MTIAAHALSILYAAFLAYSGVGKLRRDAVQVANLERVGVTRGLAVLATLELVASVGLVAGLAVWQLGAAAGAGAALYFTGAIVTHVRAGDRAIVVPLVLLGVALTVAASAAARGPA
jgi:hypothetical protein